MILSDAIFIFVDDCLLLRPLSELLLWPFRITIALVIPGFVIVPRIQLENNNEIWDSFVEGEDLSFRRLIFDHYEALYTYGTRFTRDGDLVKDAIQDLFLVLWNRRGTLNRPQNIKAYLFAALRRMVHRKVDAARKTLAKEEEIDPEFDFEISIETEYIKEETAGRLAERIAAAVGRLPSRQKEVIFLKFYHAFDRNEIAEAMGISPQTVSNLLQIALGKLKDDFGHFFDASMLYFVIPLLLKELF